MTCFTPVLHKNIPYQRWGGGGGGGGGGAGGFSHLSEDSLPCNIYRCLLHTVYHGHKTFTIPTERVQKPGKILLLGSEVWQS